MSPSAVDTVDWWDWRKPAAILVGNEGNGLSDEEVRICDALLRIPHRATVESLNSAIAASVVLYEAYKQTDRSMSGSLFEDDKCGRPPRMRPLPTGCAPRPSTMFTGRVTCWNPENPTHCN